ncbi:PREDICTED: uncharacterized protein LOC108748670 [Trachymyrmex septentrionalis]|uniref:uncharacterized protein LOC108748670 n=1 Tax=Trachymyrmex septentrionalis TaxID=34720 RepID=UPI00084F47DF|nr:PREDICTED: uncharacterized protein LOC108748670 [Trachymyrmex septentrionalis]
MITQHQFLLLIHILYCVAIHGILLDANDAETCNLLCIKCNGSAVFANGHCECNFVDDSNKECIQHIQKEIQAVELNMLSDDLTDEERKIRSVLKYRRRLRPGDAEKVAQYFINGGPEAGHSHFVRVFNATRDSIDSATNSFSGVVDKKNYTSYVSPTMQGVDLSTLGTKPPFIYPPTGVYDPTTVPLNTISHPHGLPHALLKAVTFPAHVLHRILHPRVYHHYPLHHRGIIRSSNFPQDTSDTDQTVGQCENNDGSNTSNFPIARSNADKPEQNVFGLNNPLQYPVAYIADELYQPMQYQNYPYPYNSYYNPLINMFHAVPNEYLLQSMSLYPQDKLSNPWTSASNPQSFCKNNINTEQKNEVLSADKTKYSNEMEKSDDPTKNNIPNEEKKTVKNGNDKS